MAAKTYSSNRPPVKPARRTKKKDRQSIEGAACQTSESRRTTDSGAPSAERAKACPIEAGGAEKVTRVADTFVPSHRGSA